MKVIFYGGASEVTGSLFYFQTKKLKFLVDCGLYQEGQNSILRNEERFRFRPKDIDFVIITHGHLDHIGLLPRLYREGFRGKIFCTEPTKFLMRAILEDFIRISEECNDRRLCDFSDIDGLLELVVVIPYNRVWKVDSNFYFLLRDSGHILGSCFVVFSAEGKKVLVTGDLGNLYSSLHSGPADPEEVDYVITEAVYGAFRHKTKTNKRDLLEDEIEEIVTRRGALLIPSFALDRAQELLYDLNYLVENHKIPYIPIFFDSPLAIEITRIYRNFIHYFKSEARNLIVEGDEIFHFPGLTVCQTRQQSMEINNVPNPKIIIAGSGMSNGGRILYHEIRYLPDPSSTLLIIGWQAYGTLGRELINGASRVTILNKDIEVKAKIKILDGYSGHPDQSELLHWFTKFPLIPKKVFVAQSEYDNAKVFARLLMDNLGINCVIPQRNEEYEL